MIFSDSYLITSLIQVRIRRTQNKQVVMQHTTLIFQQYLTRFHQLRGAYNVQFLTQAYANLRSTCRESNCRAINNRKQKTIDLPTAEITSN